MIVTPFKFAFTIVTTNVLCVFIIMPSDRLRTILRCNSLQLTRLSMLQLQQLKLTGGVWRIINYFPTITGNTARLKNAVDLSHVFPKIIVWRYPLLVDTFLSPDNKVTVVNIAHKYPCLHLVVILVVLHSCVLPSTFSKHVIVSSTNLSLTQYGRFPYSNSLGKLL